MGKYRGAFIRLGVIVLVVVLWSSWLYFQNTRRVAQVAAFAGVDTARISPRSFSADFILSGVPRYYKVLSEDGKKMMTVLFSNSGAIWIMVFPAATAPSVPMEPVQVEKSGIKLLVRYWKVSPADLKTTDVQVKHDAIDVYYQSTLNQTHYQVTAFRGLVQQLKCYP